jgi:signal transduction histidine kinase/CheY-like chemotaxis protein
MTTLPRKARMYLIAVWAIAIGLISFILLRYPPQIQNAQLFFLWLILLILSDYFEAIFEIGPGNRLGMTVAEIVAIFLVAVEGYSATIIILLGTALVGIARQPEWYKNAFNVAQRSIYFILMCTVYITLHAPGTTPFSGPLGLITLLAIGVIAYTVNTFFVATMIALASERSIMQVYRKTFYPILWTHLVPFPLGAILAVLWTTEPWFLALGILPIILAQRALKSVAAWQATLEAQKAELAAVNTKLSQAQQARLDAVLSETHTANNRLSAIQAATERLLRQLGDGFAEDSERIRATVAAMGTFIDDMQALALLQRDQLVIRRYEADMVAIVADAAGRVETAYRQRHIQLRLSILSEDALAVICDPPRLVQVFQHLLDQARDAVARCPVGIVTAELSATEDHAVVQIADNGAGMAAEDLAALQAQIAQVTKGDVLLAEPEFGLLSCARLIALHNGSLAVASAGLNQGTSVTISLPRLCVLSSTPLLAANAQAPLHVLVVDDDTTVAGSLARLLHQRGYEVVTAPDGQQGLLSYRTRRFDVVICDALMPDLSGPAFVRALRAYDPQAAILALSGQPGASHVEEMLLAGASEAISKPCLIEELVAAIARICRNDSAYGTAYGIGH